VGFSSRLRELVSGGTILEPIDVIKWSCVGIFVFTSILTLLHVSGLRLLPDPKHGRILFQALIVEIVVIAVMAFGTSLNAPDRETPGAGMTGVVQTEMGMPGQVVEPDPSSTMESSSGIPQKMKRPTAIAPPEKPQDGIAAENLTANCREITFNDFSTYPARSVIEVVCDDK
jgi:hypothetical protein